MDPLGCVAGPEGVSTCDFFSRALEVWICTGSRETYAAQFQSGLVPDIMDHGQKI